MGIRSFQIRCLSVLSGVMASAPYPIAVTPDGLRKAGKVEGVTTSFPLGNCVTSPLLPL